MARPFDRDAGSVAPGDRPLGHRPRLVDAAPVRGDDRSRELLCERVSAELPVELRQLGRVPLGLVPVTGSPFDKGEIPERPGLAARVVLCLSPLAELQQQREGGIEVERPGELVAEVLGRPLDERAARERPFERERLFHLGARDAASAPEQPFAVDGERAAPERRVVRPGRSSDGQLGAGHATLDPRAPAHQVGVLEVDRRLEGNVALGVRECLGVQLVGVPRLGSREHVGELDEDLGPPRPRRRRRPRVGEQVDRAGEVAGDVVPVGGEE